MLWILPWKERDSRQAAVWFIEVKDGLAAQLTDNELAMRQTIEGVWGQYIVVRSVDDVERLLRRG